MRKITQLAVGAMLLAGTAVGFSAPAAAHVSIGIGIGIGVPIYPAPIYPGYYPPGRCYDYDYDYDGYCGYDTYYDPVFIGGSWYSGRHYYRHHHHHPEVWFRGGWHSDYRGGWRDRDDWDRDRGWDRDRDRDRDWDGHGHRDHW
ncbi:MAG: hypothetical protein HY243_11625 [Proteobacteria bacterium]|nr:hypothetical protein [Pseudomonadota bacterium]